MSGKRHTRPNRPQASSSKSQQAGRFQKGRSGNPRGRPRGSGKQVKQDSAFETLLDKTVAANVGGETREISMEEALWHRTFKDALAGKGMATREVVKWIIQREAWLEKHGQPSQAKVTRHISPDPDNADEALVLLGIAAPNPARADIGCERAQLLLEPWAVQLAFRRKRGRAGPDASECNTIRRCTRDSQTLIFPGDGRRGGQVDGSD